MTAADVSRLLGRAAFGATRADLDRWTGEPYADLVDELLAVTELPVIPPHPDDPRRATGELAEQDVNEHRRLWLERMRTTPYPLLERMTLLWHGHFATALRYPPHMSQMVRQNTTLRTHALGDFRELAAAMTTDPAMLMWLNGNENAAPTPNENYSREFFELFTLGTSPQVYTERDVREAARAFTGWIVNSTGRAQFVANRHDARPKRVLGRTIANLGDQEHRAVLDAALAQPVAAQFVATKLVTHLAYVPGKGDRLVARTAAALKKSWSVKDAVGTLLRADEFRYASPARGRQLVRTPVQTFVHAAKALDVAFDDKTFVWPLQRMGHALYDPLDVSGWPVGHEWITPVTALARYDAALAFWQKANAAPTRRLDPLPEAGDLAGWASRLGLTGFSRNTTNAVGAYLRRTQKNGATERQAGVLALLLSSPEWVVV